MPVDELLTVAQAIVCYVGSVVYGSVLSVPGRRSPGLSAYIVLFYLGLFPLPPGTGALLLQEVVLGIVFGVFGAHVLCLQLQAYREMRAAEAGRAVHPLPVSTRVLVYAPAIAIVTVVVGGGIPRLLAVPESARATVWSEMERPGHVWILLTLAVYAVVAWVVGRGWLRKVGSVRLLASAVWFNRLNLVLGLCIGGLAALFLVRDPDSVAGRGATLVGLVFGLLPATIELRSVYDAAVRRVLTFHLVALIAAGVLLGGAAAAGALGLAPRPAQWTMLGVLAVVAMAVPGRIDRLVERVLFPRAALMRARLADVASGLVAAATRAEAGEELLRRVLDVLDGEGGILVLAATAAEGPAVLARGRADPGPLGGTAAGAMAYLARLPLGGKPRPVDLLPLGDRLCLLRCETVLVCPLEAEAVLLLGPRRGWPYDAAVQEALAAFGVQAGLALANITLTAARLQAEKLGALGEAAARIAHEIRNPLAGARSLVQQAAAMDGAAPLVAPAIEELDRIGRLVGDLLAFARVDDRRSPETVDLAEVCRRACVQLGTLAAASAVVVAADLQLTPALGDRDRLVQTVANLIRNGIEAAEHGGHVTVVARPDGPLAVAEIRDDGPGIPAEEMPRLFEPFRTSKRQGTGLGLAIARRIVEAHGGRLVVETAPGDTRFRVELPLRAGLDRV